MWCSQCRQDVPALPSGETQSLCCPRCGGEVCADEAPSAAPASAEATEHGSAPRASIADEDITIPTPPWYDSWELDDQLQHIQRVLHAIPSADAIPSSMDRSAIARFDGPHARQPQWHVAAPPTHRQTAKPERSSAGPGILTWLILALGTTCFVCGGILLGWSLNTGRQELWNIGLPIALVGQIALLVALIAQLDRLWYENRYAAAKLSNVDEQLQELRTTATLLGTANGPSSNVFYSHFVNGASPQLLLTDLKSQLDLLAMKIAQDQR